MFLQSLLIMLTFFISTNISDKNILTFSCYFSKYFIFYTLDHFLSKLGRILSWGHQINKVQTYFFNQSFFLILLLSQVNFYISQIKFLNIFSWSFVICHKGKTGVLKANFYGINFLFLSPYLFIYLFTGFTFLAVLKKKQIWFIRGFVLNYVRYYYYFLHYFLASFSFLFSAFNSFSSIFFLFFRKTSEFLINKNSVESVFGFRNLKLLGQGGFRQDLSQRGLFLRHSYDFLSMYSWLYSLSLCAVMLDTFFG